MKLRINNELYARLQGCAEAIGEPVSEFARLAVVNLAKGKTKRVAVPMKLMTATRKESTVMTITSTIVEEKHPMDVRLAIAKAVIFAESRAIPHFNTNLIEGHDFIINKEA